MLINCGGGDGDAGGGESGGGGDEGSDDGNYLRGGSLSVITLTPTVFCLVRWQTLPLSGYCQRCWERSFRLT